MDRAEKAGFGVALAGHAALLAVLSLGWVSVRQPPLLNDPIEVSIVDEVALRSAAPSVQAPAPAIAPELGAPEEPAPVAEPTPPEPAPPIQAEPLPPPPQPRPVPKAVVTPVSKPVVKAAPPKTAPTAKPALVKASPAQTAAKGKAVETRGSLLGRDFLKGIGSDPAPAKTASASGAVMSAVALAGIKSAIQRQIQPCADRQVNPGPGANQIQVTLNLRLNRDGSLAQHPSVVRTAGVTEENGRYEKRVTDLAIASYTGCAPLRGLPDELYQTGKGGWSNINMTYKLPG
jgi:outer membrane biosynthesis protein TonB